ncbi:MAG: pyridoxamine 5'-phosphate oxidase family protein [Thermomicrobiales bacterium]|nr:pyridoxamine 5'-phosphate oxidase family protein [Thermomicrobiales bacterium]
MTAVQDPSTFARTEQTTPSRHPERASFDRSAVYAVLDEALVCHVGYVADGRPVMIPTLHVRVEDVMYLHGSTGSSVMLQAAKGPLPVCIAVTLTDGIVLAKSWFNHSINYRSVIVHGEGTVVSDPIEKWNAMVALMDHVAEGRAEGSRSANKRELAATAMLRIPLEAVSMKFRAGPPKDDEIDLDLPYWTGVIPMTTMFDAPRPAGDIALPDYLMDYARGVNGPR